MASSVLNAPQFQNEDAAFAYVEARAVAEWPGLPSLWRNRAHWPPVGQDYPSGPAQVLRLQEALHRPHRHHLRGSPSAAASVASGHPFDVRQQERHLDPANPADAQLQHENRVVPWPSHPPRHGPRRPTGPLGGDGKTVEADETVLPIAARPNAARTQRPNVAVFSLVERGGDDPLHRPRPSRRPPTSLGAPGPRRAVS